MAFAPMVLPVPAGPRRRKFRILVGLPVVSWACLQMSTASWGMMYHSGRMGTWARSAGLSTRLGFNTYWPIKSLWSMTFVGLCTIGSPFWVKMVNSPASTSVGWYSPESSWARETRIRLPDLSTFTFRWVGQALSLMRR